MSALQQAKKAWQGNDVGYTRRLLRSAPMARSVFAALLLLVVGLLAIDQAMATDDVNPAGAAITATKTLSGYTAADTYTNNGSISSSSSPALRMADGTLGAIINNGVIYSYAGSGIYSYAGFGLDIVSSHIGSIVNAGSITGDVGIYAGPAAGNSTNIGTLTNSGQLMGISSGVTVDACTTIDTLTNTGTIGSTAGSGISVYGSVGTLNNSGTISGSQAAISSMVTSGIGVVNNSGTILGSIVGKGNFVINGASSGMGIMAGVDGGIGQILNYGDLTFGTGNLLLNDNVNVVGHPLVNTGANLYVSNQVTIASDYTQSAGASLNVNVGSDPVKSDNIPTNSGYGRLVVNGAANIASGSWVNLVNQGYGFAGGQRFVVIRALLAGTNYNASTLNYSAPGFLEPISGAAVTSDSYQDLVVSLSGTAPLIATTPNALSTLGGLQSYSGTSALQLLDLYNASLAIGSTAEANKAGEQLAPTASTASAGAAAATATFDMLNIIGNHIGSLQGSGAGSPQGSGTGGSRGMAAGDATMDWGAWGQAFGGRADQDTVDQVSGYRAYYGGFVTGIDRAVTDSWRLGGALSYTRTNVDGAGNVDGSQTDVDSYGLTAYASYTGKPWYANLFVSGAEQSYHSKRLVNFTGFSGVANGDFDGQQFAAKAEIGYPIALTPRLTLTPLGELSYSYSHLDDYTETGGNGAALSVDGSDSYALRSGIGGKLATTVPTSFGEVVPFIQAMWLHQYNDGRTGVTAQYAGDPLGETAFTSFGAKPIADIADLTVGATLMSSDDFSVTARYGAQLAPNYTNQTLSLRLRQLF